MKKISLLFAVFMFACISNYAQDSASYAEYYGTYDMPPGSQVDKVSIAWINDALNITSDMGNALLANTGVDSFLMDYMNGTIIFNRDSATHKVNGLTIIVSGYTMVATREADGEGEKAAGGNSARRKKLLFEIKHEEVIV